MFEFERPLVSFALVAYNQEKYIREAVEGALSQTYSPLEIIISDDCSTDATFKIINDIADSYNGSHKIRINQNIVNIGVGAHINHVMEMASGEFVVLAAGDDISYPERVESIMSAWLSEQDVVAVCSQARCINGDGEILADRYSGYDESYPKQDESRQSCLMRLIMNGECILLGCTEAWSRRLFDIFGNLREGVVHEDNVLSFRAWLVGKIKYLEAPLVDYRQHESNICFSVVKEYRTTKEIYLLEKKRAVSSHRKKINYEQYLDDLHTAKNNCLVDSRTYASLKLAIETRLVQEDIRASWWNISFFERMEGITKSAKYINIDDYVWCLARLVPLACFVRVRVLVGVISRCVRSARGILQSKHCLCR